MSGKLEPSIPAAIALTDAAKAHTLSDPYPPVSLVAHPQCENAQALGNSNQYVDSCDFTETAETQMCSEPLPKPV